jgi:hypothetical protein
MRKTSFSRKYRRISWFRRCADARSRPNGFSTITRDQPSSARRSPISRMSIGIALGGTAR